MMSDGIVAGGNMDANVPIHRTQATGVISAYRTQKATTPPQCMSQKIFPIIPHIHRPQDYLYAGARLSITGSFFSPTLPTSAPCQ